ncbi:TetR/AcrR family transcriptional regulator [Jeotgalibaca caeni]|uniref:TetR/AcrR family transcriptional regulator n=1 Tax=Jeotgalibaca caeni TaxID=3028623 RepID=UPI00237D5649|nr:TetR/AcrR family transcriptional regulator [Jeotgalibaca caeni]MDE1548835.1 TetR/AcrR family transcriptional regulator [Jeotgalibaca caeni]
MRNQSRQTDRRVIRTKREILGALTQLLEQKSIDEITVKEITDLAGINRGTFYLHYVDKYDLFEKSVNQVIVEMRDIGQTILMKVSENSDPEVLKKEVSSSMGAIFEYALENHRFIKSLLSENSTYSFHHKFNEILNDYFVETMKDSQTEVPPVYLVAAISYAVEGLIHSWLQGGMKESPEEMGDICFEIIYRNMSGVMNNQNG